MFQHTMALLRKVGNIIHDYREVFEVIRDWYKDSKRTVKIARSALRIAQGESHPIPWINGNPLERVHDDQNPWTYIHAWKIPTQCLRRGENLITVQFEGRSTTRVVEACVFQEEGLGRRVVEFAEKTPSFSTRFRLHDFHHARHQNTHWTVKADGRLVFRLMLEETDPIVFSLESLPDDAWKEIVKEILDEVRDRVEKKIEEFARELRRRNTRPSQSEATEENLRALQEYLDLHDFQIRTAFAQRDEVTLHTVIEHTGNPEERIQPSRPRRNHTPRESMPNPHQPPFAEPAGPATQASTTGGMVGAATKGVAAVGMSGGKMLGLLALVTIVAAPVIYAISGGNLPDLAKKLFGSKSGNQTEIMTALRESTNEMGWNRDGENIYDDAQLKQMLGEFAGLNDANAKMFDGPMKIYWVGEKGRDIPAFMLGKPGEEGIWRRALGVIDLGSEESANRYWNHQREFLNQAMNGNGANLGVAITVTDFAANGTQRARIQRTTFQNNPVETIAMAQVGQFIFITKDAEPLPPGADLDEAKRRLEVLANRLGRGSNQPAPMPKAPANQFPGEDRKGVLGIPVPGSKE